MKKNSLVNESASWERLSANSSKKPPAKKNTLAQSTKELPVAEEPLVGGTHHTALNPKEGKKSNLKVKLKLKLEAKTVRGHGRGRGLGKNSAATRKLVRNS